MLGSRFREGGGVFIICFLALLFKNSLKGTLSVGKAFAGFVSMMHRSSSSDSFNFGGALAGFIKPPRESGLVTRCSGFGCGLLGKF